MVNNFEIIKPLLKFDNEYEFYFLQVIQRKKDHKDGQLLKSNNNSRLIKAYYIYSIEQLEKYETEIVNLCHIFNARAGIGLNKRNAKSISLEMLSLLAQNIKSDHFKQLGSLYNTVCGHHFEGKDKCWILDLDGHYSEHYMEILQDTLCACPPEGNKIIAVVPSKNGCHVITKPFDVRTFTILYPEIEIHKNNPTNLYIP